MNLRLTLRSAAITAKLVMNRTSIDITLRQTIEGRPIRAHPAALDVARSRRAKQECALSPYILRHRESHGTGSRDTS